MGLLSHVYFWCVDYIWSESRCKSKVIRFLKVLLEIVFLERTEVVSLETTVGLSPFLTLMCFCRRGMNQGGSCAVGVK